MAWRCRPSSVKPRRATRARLRWLAASVCTVTRARPSGPNAWSSKIAMARLTRPRPSNAASIQYQASPVWVYRLIRRPAVLADCLNLSPGTAVRWMHQAGADWNRYAADIARSRDHQP